MLVVFPPIFVVDTKIISGYNFVAYLIANSFHIFSESILLLISNFKRKVGFSTNADFIVILDT